MLLYMEHFPFCETNLNKMVHSFLMSSGKRKVDQNVIFFICNISYLITKRQIEFTYKVMLFNFTLLLTETLSLMLVSQHIPLLMLVQMFLLLGHPTVSAVNFLKGQSQRDEKSNGTHFCLRENDLFRRSWLTKRYLWIICHHLFGNSYLPFTGAPIYQSQLSVNFPNNGHPSRHNFYFNLPA